MFQEARYMDHEHPLHNWIYDPNDAYFEKYMNEEELNILRKYPELPQKNENIEKLFTSLENITTLKALKRKLDDVTFGMDTEVDECWAKITLEEFIYMYNYRAVEDLSKDGQEKDLPEKGSTATDSNVNQYSVTGTLIPNKFACPRPDLIVKKNGYEYLISEAGLDDDKDKNLKEEYEGKLKVPKELKNMLERLILAVDDFQRGSKLLVGHVQNHLRMNTAVLDRPGGYACRVLYLDEVEIPLDVELIWSQLTQVLEAAWKSKEIVLTTYKSFMEAKSTETPSWI